MAHEIGHNVGMAHDFSDAHKAAGCDGTGIMSYGNPPNQWSTCSKADFTAQYKARESTWCMPGKHSHSSLWLRLNYYTQKLGGIGSIGFHIK